MNDSLDLINKIYKPYRLTKKSSVTIASTTSGDYIIKQKGNKDIKELYKYLASRSFNNYPKLIDGTRNEVNVFEYIEDISTPLEQKASDMMNLISSLHSKTTYFKEITTSQYQEIYDNILANIANVKNNYDDLFNTCKMQIYMSPSNYLLIKNSSKIYEALEYSLNKINDWFETIKNSTKQRVSVIHNNLNINHFIKNKQDYLISWEHSKIDSPILDLINFYKNDYLLFDFSELVKKYNNNYQILDQELTLFFAIITIPPIYNTTDTELLNCYNLRKILDYIYKTEIFITNYQKNNN